MDREPPAARRVARATLLLVAVCAAAVCDADRPAPSGAVPKTLVVETTFESRMERDGRERMRRTGRGTKWIDLAGNRRRDELECSTLFDGGSRMRGSSITVFDGRNLFFVLRTSGGAAGVRTDLAAAGPVPHVAEEGLLPRSRDAEEGPAERVLGRSCRVFHSRDGVRREWIWRGVVLKSELRDPNGVTVVEEAVRVRENVRISGRKFAAPAGVRFEGRPAGGEGRFTLDAGVGPWALPFSMRCP